MFRGISLEHNRFRTARKMPRNLFDVSKILPITFEKVEKYITCKYLIEALSPIPDIKFEFLNEEKTRVHHDTYYTFTIGLTGLIKHTAHLVQDIRFEELEDEEKTYKIIVEKSNEVEKSEVRVKVEDMGDKINVKVSLIQLYFKSGVLELVGRRIVINRFRAEVVKVLKKTAKKLRDGSLEPIFQKCDEEFAKEGSDQLY
ncbi:MAG: hypothetical protein HWN66_01025 [Candidatus Helarchaeota archaeon]|nr:hypothetical protein [Candidatus Helarchaeota archaeon]